MRHIHVKPPDPASIDQLPSYSDIVNYNTIPQASFFLKFFGPAVARRPRYPFQKRIWCGCAAFQRIDKLAAALPRWIDPQLAHYLQRRQTALPSTCADRIGPLTDSAVTSLLERKMAPPFRNSVA
jgi:hypothetical protein